MGYDDAKELDGRAYSGMTIGGTHDWDYPNGRWRERKAAPDRWDVHFSAVKRRRRAAPDGSGAAPGTQYHWFLLGHQRVRKIDADHYQTLLEGVKWRVGHKRPHWRAWSTEYPGTRSARDRVVEILEETLATLRAEGAADAEALEAALSPVPGAPRRDADIRAFS